MDGVLNLVEDFPNFVAGFMGANRLLEPHCYSFVLDVRNRSIFCSSLEIRRGSFPQNISFIWNETWVLEFRKKLLAFDHMIFVENGKK